MITVPFASKDIFYDRAASGWRAVISDSYGRLSTYPVIFWKIRAGGRFAPIACIGAMGITDAEQFEGYLGVAGPMEDVEARFKESAIEYARNQGTSPLEIIGAEGV